jgi:hypothetical protein
MNILTNRASKEGSVAISTNVRKRRNDSSDLHNENPLFDQYVPNWRKRENMRIGAAARALYRAA